MKLISYRRAGATGVGQVDGSLVLPYPGVTAIGPDSGAAELEAVGVDRSLAFALVEAELLPASPQPSKVFCVGLNYREHVEETGRELPAYPVLFPKFAASLIPANAAIACPRESAQIDYEGELAVIIGAAGRRIREEDAFDHVLGYAAANDVTMRDYQYKTHQWMQGKAWDGSTPVGPYVVTSDEVDISHAGIRTVLNGTVVQESDLSMLIFSIPRLIAVISEFTELLPGDVILTGTPGGVGFRRDPQLFLQPGDEVIVEVDGVGRVHNRVVAEARS